MLKTLLVGQLIAANQEVQFHYVFNYAVIYWIDKIRNMHSKISSPRASTL